MTAGPGGFQAYAVADAPAFGLAGAFLGPASSAEDILAIAFALLPAGGGGVRSLLTLLSCVGPSGTATTAAGGAGTTVGTAAVSTVGLGCHSATAGEASASPGFDTSAALSVAAVLIVAAVVPAASSACCLHTSYSSRTDESTDMR